MLDSVATGFTANGYPALLFLKKNESSYNLLNNPQKQLAWSDNETMMVCAKLLSFDNSYSMQLAGNFTMNEVSRLRGIALMCMGKTPAQPHTEAP